MASLSGRDRSDDAIAAQRLDFERDGETVTVKRLPSGYYHLRGFGPCNWAQPREWPCDPDDLAFFEEAGQPFRRAVLAENAALRGDDDDDE